MNEEKPKKKNFLEKIKKIKHLDIILTVLFIAIILLIYFSTFSISKDKPSTQNEISLTSDFDNYKQSLTYELEQLISAMKGVTSVKVMLYYNSSIEKQIAYDVNITTTASGEKIETKTPILITNNGKEEVVVLQEIMPEPESVVIVAGGAENANIKLEIIKLVETTFKISTSKIEVFAGK